MRVGIIGGGPSGLATADHLTLAGHEVVVFEKGPIAGNISKYPTYMTWFSTKELLEIGGMPLTIASDKPTRREYLQYLTRFVQFKGLDVRVYHEVHRVDGERGRFSLVGQTRTGDGWIHDCEVVVLATGAYDDPQMLHIPGEDLPKVSHYYTEPHPYVGQNVLIVGGRNSAVETALELWRNGANVTISYRRAEFPTSVKYWLKPDIENRIKAGEITAFMPSRVVSCSPHSVSLELEGREITIDNDFVLALTGYEPDTRFMRSLGIRIDPDTKRPTLDPETYESNIPGIYVVGVIQAGNISSEIFIENSRLHGAVIARALEVETGVV